MCDTVGCEVVCTDYLGEVFTVTIIAGEEDLALVEVCSHIEALNSRIAGIVDDSARRQVDWEHVVGKDLSQCSCGVCKEVCQKVSG